MLLEAILPQHPGLVVSSWKVEDKKVKVCLRSSRCSSICPSCGSVSERVHSRYVRSITDLPLCGHSLVYEIEVRRFFCEGRDCKHDIFCERLGEIANRYGRRTKRLDELLVQLGLLFSAEVGAKFVGISKVELSPDTLLRLARKGFAPDEKRTPMFAISAWTTGPF